MSPRSAVTRGCLGIASVALLLGAAACTRIEEPAAKPAQAAPAAPQPPAERSTVQLAIDGATGKIAVDASKKARATIEQVKASEAADMQEVENF